MRVFFSAPVSKANRFSANISCRIYFETKFNLGVLLEISITVLASHFLKLYIISIIVVMNDLIMFLVRRTALSIV